MVSPVRNAPAGVNSAATSAPTSRGGAGLAAGNPLVQVRPQRPARRHRVRIEVGRDVAGRHVHHADALGAPTRRPATGDGAHGGLAGAVRQVALDAQLVEERADVDDHAAAGSDKVRVGGLAGGHHRSCIGVHHLVPLLQGHLGRDRVEVHAGVVDQSLRCASRRRRAARKRRPAPRAASRPRSRRSSGPRPPRAMPARPGERSGARQTGHVPSLLAPAPARWRRRCRGSHLSPTMQSRSMPWFLSVLIHR